MNIKIICIGLIGIFLLSSTNVVGNTINNENNKVLLEIADHDYEIHLGKIKIIDNKCSLELNEEYKDEIVITEGDQLKKYKLVIDYEYSESILNFASELWEFWIFFNPGVGNKPEDYKAFSDTLNPIDGGSGELSLEATGYNFWNGDYNYPIVIHIEACHYHWSCTAEGDWYYFPDNWMQIDKKIRCENFPKPELEWAADEGIDFGEVKIGETKEMKFTLTNVGGWKTTKHVYLKRSGSDNFDDDSWIRLEKEFSLEPGQSKTFTIKFKPDSEGEKTTTIKTSHQSIQQSEPWWHKDCHAEITIKGTGYEKEGISAIDQFQKGIFACLINQFPLLQQFLQRLPAFQ